MVTGGVCVDGMGSAVMRGRSVVTEGVCGDERGLR